MNTQRTLRPDHVRLAAYESAASAIDCSCVLTRHPKDGLVVFRLCPIHAAAPDLLAALKAWDKWFRQGEKAPLYRSDQAIAKAKEK